MYAAHEAFRRDLRRLGPGVESLPLDDRGLVAGWETFKQQLCVHHIGEDMSLWPQLRAATTDPDDLAVIENMESDHAGITPLLRTADVSLAAQDRSGLTEAISFLSRLLETHMGHEEREALPLIERTVGPRGWKVFTRSMGKTQGLKGGAVFFPWMLDEASDDIVHRVLRQIPPPVRMLYRRVWQPRYARRPGVVLPAR